MRRYEQLHRLSTKTHAGTAGRLITTLVGRSMVSVSSDVFHFRKERKLVSDHPRVIGILHLAVKRYSVAIASGAEAVSVLAFEDAVDRVSDHLTPLAGVGSCSAAQS